MRTSRQKKYWYEEGHLRLSSYPPHWPGCHSPGALLYRGLGVRSDPQTRLWYSLLQPKNEILRLMISRRYRHAGHQLVSTGNFEAGQGRCAPADGFQIGSCESSRHPHQSAGSIKVKTPPLKTRQCYEAGLLHVCTRNTKEAKALHTIWHYKWRACSKH